MSFFSEFKEFAVKGNVVDMAVGVIIGGAFGKIVSSLVSDIIMPPIGKAMGGLDFSSYFINLGDKPVKDLAQAAKEGIPVIAYGKFFTNIIDFIIIAFVIYLLICQINRMKTPEPEPEPDRLCPFCKSPVDKEATRCPHCTSEIPLE